MKIVARVPGKLVLLGEYAVLDGGEALVMAVDRQCFAAIEPAQGSLCELTILAPDASTYEFSPGAQSGVALVDLVIERLGCASVGPAWRCEIDTRDFFSTTTKLGLGSSAAALTAFAGAWSRYSSQVAGSVAQLDVVDLIELHRMFQGGAGSGLDVAASVTGGVISYCLGQSGLPHIGSVQLPNSVGFAGVFAGTSASTPDFVARFRAWKAAEPRESAHQLDVMRELSAAGLATMQAGDADGFLAVVRDYGGQLGQLGDLIGSEIVTAEHREIGELADRCGVAYKVSGAGGGDLGIALSCEPGRLNALRDAVNARGYEWIDLVLDREGLVVEERV